MFEARQAVDVTLTSGTADIGLWESRAEQYGYRYYGQPPAERLADLAADFQSMRPLLGLPLIVADRTRVCRATAQLAGMTAIVLHDLGNRQESTAWFRTAGRAAQESGDRSPHAWVPDRQAMVPLNLDAPGYHPVLIEQWITGTEITVAVADIDGEPTALPAAEIAAPGLYDYSARYTAGATTFHTPARLDQPVAAEAARVAVAAHRTLGLRHLSRTDAIVTPDGQVHVLETNVAPGMTQTTYPIALTAAGYDLAAHLQTLASATCQDPRRADTRRPVGSPDQ
ncbi:hypothetical protein [Streptomyces telluris]|uniref:ATP-grasp domain-containing protein n=1 Tax=Streptomyces telluris TaxID=2720021 RepID=A0A9X2RNK7_9ACTN|nr:hypothetical protein [Streptomyces telluris]MCQ8773067.1 hypothetical protein [Streptomyces telluris]